MAGPSFQFRLERVRSLRERKRRLAERELAEALSSRTHSERQLDAAEASLRRAQSQQRELGHERALAGEQLIAAQAFLERLEAQRGERRRELELKSAEVHRRDALLTAAATEHKILDRLRERQRCAHAREAARREQGALDELAAVRFRRSAA